MNVLIAIACLVAGEGFFVFALCKAAKHGDRRLES
jgi:hypothetical protein